MSMKFGDIAEDYVTVGQRVLVKPFTVIGMTGFGFERVKGGGKYDYKYPLRRKKHDFKVIIGDDVEIGVGCVIDRGSWRHSIIGKGTKIDNMVHTGHNTHIGEHCLIVVGTTIGGSCTIGNKCFLGMNCVILPGLTIADKVTIGAGAVVTKSITEKGTSWAGIPARKIEKKNYESFMAH